LVDPGVSSSSSPLALRLNLLVMLPLALARLGDLATHLAQLLGQCRAGQYIDADNLIAGWNGDPAVALSRTQGAGIL
jgi:hypothetical protein